MSWACAKARHAEVRTLLLRLPLRDQPPSKKNDHGGISTFFFSSLLFFSNISVFFHTKETLLGCELLVWDNSPPRTLEVGSIG